MKQFGNIIIGLIMGLLFLSFAMAQPKIDIQKASEIFKETKALCLKDNGLLWGRSLNVPLIFVDPNTRMIVSNSADKSGILSLQKDVFVGYMPEQIQITKGTIQLGGKRYAILPWPLPSNTEERQLQIIHEAFHCLQPELNLQPQPYHNGHMDQMEARLWLKLEWEALEKAVRSKAQERKQAITDAVLFRIYRRALYKASEEYENRFEIHEGMAEYTAQKICSTKTDLKVYLTKSLKILWKAESFVNNFAYCSGPLYGFLLDASGIEWRNQLSAKDDLARITQKAYNITLPKDIYLEAEERSVRYRGALIMGEELDREAEL
ncbi:MAG: hypothetical protein ACEPOZ_03125 [Marinifilaceae bacterium]